MNISPVVLLAVVGAAGVGVYFWYQKAKHDEAMAELTKPVDLTKGNTLTASNQAIMDVIGAPGGIYSGYGRYMFQG